MTMSSELCRICLNILNHDTVTYNIFNQEIWGETYAFRIAAISNIQINESQGLPKCICSDCAYRVDDSFSLKEQIKESDEYLKSIKLEVKNENLEEEIINDTVFYVESNAETYSECPFIYSQENNIDDNLTKKCASYFPVKEDEQYSLSTLKIKDSNEHYPLSLTCENFNFNNREDDLNEIPLEANFENYEIREFPEVFPSEKTSKSKEAMRTNRKKNIHSSSLKKTAKRKKVMRKKKKINMHSNPPETQQISYTLKEEAKTKEVSDTGPFTCNICGRIIASRVWFRIHMRKHNSAPMLKCEICDKSFIYNRDLKRHVKVHTREDDPQRSVCYNEDETIKPKTGVFLCNVCGKIMTSKIWFNIHIRRYHSAQMLKCETCGKSFVYKYELKCHIKTHKEI